MNEGQYKARATEVMLGKSKEKGTPFVGVLFKIVEGPHEGETLKWDGWLTDKTAERTIEALQICGWKGDDLSELSKGMNGVDGNEVTLVVEMETFDGREYPRVKWVNRSGSRKLQGTTMDVAEAAAFGARFKGLAMATRAKGHAPADTPVSKEEKAKIPF